MDRCIVSPWQQPNLDPIEIIRESAEFLFFLFRNKTNSNKTAGRGLVRREGFEAMIQEVPRVCV